MSKKNKIKKCKECDGTGQLGTLVQHTIFDSAIRVKTIPCEACNGRGYK